MSGQGSWCSLGEERAGRRKPVPHREGTDHANAQEALKPVLNRGPQAGLNVIKESEAQLWWAAKELRRTKKLSDYVGKNEKTKIIVKIQHVSALTLMCHGWFFLTYFHTGKNLQ